MKRLATIGMLLALLSPPSAIAASHPCQTGVASAPFIGRADMRAIVRSTKRLPESHGSLATLNVGSAVPGGVALAALPKAVTHVLPQYRHYRGFRDNIVLAIVDPHGRRLVYLLPLDGTATPKNCP